MNFMLLTLAAAVPFAVAMAGTQAAAEPKSKISGPHSHDNLTVYFVHGDSAQGAVPLTLAEALEKGAVHVIETGSVNELQIENLGRDDIFIQSGDIVKGGKQDRVLTTTLLLKPKSGKVPIDAFCVEQGRWNARGAESVMGFASASEAMPSREAKLAMRRPVKAAAADLTTGALPQDAQTRNLTGVSSRQGEVWDEVAKTQEKLSASLLASVTRNESASSLQLALENEKLKDARAAFVAAIEAKGTAEGDIVGMVFAVNGRLNSADIYPSNGLFRKMWAKQLSASVTEAIGDKDGTKGAVPGLDDVRTFIDGAHTGKLHKAAVSGLMDIETRDADSALYTEAKSAGGAWVHRSYVAK